MCVTPCLAAGRSHPSCHPRLPNPSLPSQPRPQPADPVLPVPLSPTARGARAEHLAASCLSPSIRVRHNLPQPCAMAASPLLTATMSPGLPLARAAAGPPARPRCSTGRASTHSPPRRAGCGQRWGRTCPGQPFFASPLPEPMRSSPTPPRPLPAGSGQAPGGTTPQFFLPSRRLPASSCGGSAGG